MEGIKKEYKAWKVPQIGFYGGGWILGKEKSENGCAKKYVVFRKINSLKFCIALKNKKIVSLGTPQYFGYGVPKKPKCLM